jgi:hypothetical protein
VRVEVTLFATLARYLPVVAPHGWLLVEVPDGSTVEQVTRELGIPDDLPRVTLVNGADADPGQRLSPGDQLSLFPPLAGG